MHHRARVGVRPPTVSIAVKRLEEDGLVVRGPDPDDPRARRVLLAPSASLLPGLDVLGQLEGHVVEGLDASERDRLCQQLDGLRARLESTETES